MRRMRSTGGEDEGADSAPHAGRRKRLFVPGGTNQSSRCSMNRTPRLAEFGAVRSLNA
jgi:hypothetical protein